MAIDINIPSQVRTFANLAAFPASGALKTIYIAEDTNKTYRWTGSVYVEISASAGGATWGAITGTLSSQTDLQNALNAKQATLVSGTNIKTINGSSVLGSGNLVVSGGVTSVTATAPIASSGGATPNISIATADTSTTGALSSTDWTTFNNKQNGLISGTNIKTVNGGSLVGSGNLSVGTVTNVTATLPLVSSGGTTPVLSIEEASPFNNGFLLASDFSNFNNKLNGVHSFFPYAGNAITAQISALATTTVSTSGGTIRAFPFIPQQGFVVESLSINVSTLSSGGLARILIYSSFDGKPDQKLYESSNLDCSTLGIKTALTSFSFVGGTTYWLCTHTNNTIGFTHHVTGSLMNVGISSGFNHAPIYISTVTFGSAPTTFGAGTLSATSPPAIVIKPI